MADRDEDPLDSGTAAALGRRPRHAATLGPALWRVGRSPARTAEQDAGNASYRQARPGAAGLAHCGVRCLGDIDRFHTNDLEELAKAAESKRTDASRGALPADFLLVGIITSPPDAERSGDTAASFRAGVRARLDRLPMCRTFQVVAHVEATPPWTTTNHRTGGSSAMVADPSTALAKPRANAMAGLAH